MNVPSIRPSKVNSVCTIECCNLKEIRAIKSSVPYRWPYLPKILVDTPAIVIYFELTQF